MKSEPRFPTRCDPLLNDLMRRAGILVPSDDGSIDVTITSLTDDTRRLERGGCFVAVRGASIDGHTLVNQAADLGAAAIFIDREVPVPTGPKVIRVADTRTALAKLAAAYHRLDKPGAPALVLVGITGTNGKTTVAWMLRSILREAGRTPALLGTIEHDLVTERIDAALTTPGALDIARFLSTARKQGATHAVLEASSHALDQRRCDGLRFNVGVFTNLSGDHLDYHGSMERYAGAKRRLFELLEDDAPAVLNLDDPLGRLWTDEFERPILTFGLQSADADVRGVVESVDVSGSRFRMKGPALDERIRLPLIGRHNVSNALAAAAAAHALGIDATAVRDGLERLTTVPGRLERVEPEGCPFLVVVDYAHTDGALANVLDALRPLTPGRLICVFGCGGDRDRTKRPRMAAAVARIADVAYVTSDNPRSENPRAIIKEILVGFDRNTSCRVEVEADRRRAIEAALDEAQPGDTVLIAGKGHETYQLVGDEVLEFDDTAVARAWLTTPTVAEEVA